MDDLRELSTDGLPAPAELPVVQVTEPPPGGNFTAGTTVKFRWTATHPSGILSYTLYYSYDGGTTLRELVALNSNRKFYNWTIPDTLAFDVFVRVVARSVDGVSSCDDSEIFDLNLTVGLDTPAIPSAYLRAASRNERTYLDGIAPGEIPGEVVLEVYDARGRLVGTPWKGSAGDRFSVEVPRKDSDGRSLRSGVYFARLRAPGRFLQSKYVFLN